MTTINTQLLDSLGLSASTQSTQASDVLGQSDFLKLMTTQLMNQDPTKPMESGEFFNQIAQFSMVAGVEELQTSFQQVADAMQSTQTLQASAMVGRSVLVSGDTVSLADGGSAAAGVTLPASTSNLVVGVVDASGQIVRRLDLGTQPEGDVSFTWDGRDGSGAAVPAGDYTLVAEMDYDGETVALDTLVTARVNSVLMGKNGQGITLNLSNNEQVSLADIMQIM
ncbi:MAG: flagellar hook assembly protein FlgD [Gammaproteobacteria bacterium]|nr:flagellar hook assembly protein FlgD [Gammaproteobacteria bacterium]